MEEWVLAYFNPASCKHDYMNKSGVLHFHLTHENRPHKQEWLVRAVHEQVERNCYISSIRFTMNVLKNRKSTTRRRWRIVNYRMCCGAPLIRSLPYLDFYSFIVVAVTLWIGIFDFSNVISCVAVWSGLDRTPYSVSRIYSTCNYWSACHFNIRFFVVLRKKRTNNNTFECAK